MTLKWYAFTRRAMIAAVAFFIMATPLVSAPLAAAPVTFNTALPVAKGEFIWREKLVLQTRTDDTDFPDRDVRVTGVANVLGYGINGDLALFGVFPYLNKRLNVSTPMGRVQRETTGFGDMRLFARYTAFQQDSQSRTFRLAPLFGLIVPTGRDDDVDAFGRLPRTLQTGTGAWGSFAGVVATYQTLPIEYDAQFLIETRNGHDGFEAGDVTRLDLSAQFRVWPRKLTADTSGFLYAVLESNVAHQARDRQATTVVVDSGGTQWFLTPGVQYVTRRWVWEAAVQIPVQQNMHGDAIRDDYILHAGFRRNF